MLLVWVIVKDDTHVYGILCSSLTYESGFRELRCHVQGPVKSPGEEQGARSGCWSRSRSLFSVGSRAMGNP